MKRSISMRAVGALGVAAVLVFGAACSSGSDDDKADEKAEESAKGDAPEQTTTTAVELTDEEFQAGLDAFSAEIADAGGDICKMAQAQTLLPAANPANEQQSKATVAVYAGFLRAFAGTFADDPGTADTLRSTADELERSAEEAGYPKDFLTPSDPGDGPEVLSSEEYLAAIGVISQRFTEECAGQLGQTGDAPAGSEGAPAEQPTTTVAP